MERWMGLGLIPKYTGTKWDLVLRLGKGFRSADKIGSLPFGSAQRQEDRFGEHEVLRFARDDWGGGGQVKRGGGRVLRQCRVRPG